MRTFSDAPYHRLKSEMNLVDSHTSRNLVRFSELVGNLGDSTTK